MKIVLFLISTLLLGSCGPMDMTESEQITNVPQGIEQYVVKLTSTNGRTATGFHLEYRGNIYLVTNNHVCLNNTSLHDGVSNRAVIAISWAHDLCVLESDRSNGLRLSQDDPIKTERIYVFGHPHGGKLVIRAGYYSHLVTKYLTHISTSNAKEYYSVEVPIFAGNSGSPMVNLRGDVLGVIFGTNTKTHKTGYAVPRIDVINFLSQLDR